MSKQPLESKIETYLKDQIKALGGLSYKFKSTVNGVPDQIVIFDGTTHFVEVKRPGETPRADQIAVQRKIAAQNVSVCTVSTTDEIDAFIRKNLGCEPITAKKSAPKSPGTLKDIGAFDI